MSCENCEKQRKALDKARQCLWVVINAEGFNPQYIKEALDSVCEVLPGEACQERRDGRHCDCWYDGDACCSCGAPAMTIEEKRDRHGARQTPTPTGRNQFCTQCEPMPTEGEIDMSNTPPTQVQAIQARTTLWRLAENWGLDPSDKRKLQDAMSVLREVQDQLPYRKRKLRRKTKGD